MEKLHKLEKKIKENKHDIKDNKKEIKHIEKEEKHEFKEYQGEFADKRVTKETFEMIYKKLRALQEQIDQKCGAVEESGSESEYETQCQPVTM